MGDKDKMVPKQSVCYKMGIELKHKKGTHVGIILSFVIFISFVVFMYIVLQPKVVMENKEHLLEIVKDGLVSEASAEVTTGSVSIPSPEACNQINNFFSNNGLSLNMIAVDSDGDAAPIGTSGGGSHFRIVSSDGLFRFYESETFDSLTELSQNPCSDKSYTLGGLKTENIFLESKISGLATKYESNYSGLAQDLDVPSGNEFWFNFTNSGGTSTYPDEKEVLGTSVFSKDFHVIYLSEDVTMRVGELNVRVW